VNRFQQALAEFSFSQYLAVFVWSHGKSNRANHAAFHFGILGQLLLRLPSS
jgi:hypothetical protein